MITKKEAIEIFEQHIKTLQFQVTEDGLKFMRSVNVLDNTEEELQRYIKFNEKEKQAYELGIRSLKGLLDEQ